MATLFCNQIISLQKLLSVISDERKKSKPKNDAMIDNVINTFWISLFEEYFIQNDKYADDLIFYVKRGHVDSVVIDVLRRSSQQNVINIDSNIDWEETVYLNLILQQFEYTLTCSICTRTGPKDLQILKRHSQPVYASPSRRRMDIKGEEEAITYPNLFFMVDNYEEIFGDIRVKEGELVCIELVAQDKQDTMQGVIFLGAVRYQALKKVYESKASMATKLAERISLSNKVQQRTEFIKMKGPNGVGQAEIAISAKRDETVQPAKPPNCYATLPKRFSSVSAPTTPGQNSPEEGPDFSLEDVLKSKLPTNKGASRRPLPYRRNRWGGSFSTLGDMLTSWYGSGKEETPLPPSGSSSFWRTKSSSQSNVANLTDNMVPRPTAKIENGPISNGPTLNEGESKDPTTIMGCDLRGALGNDEALIDEDGNVNGQAISSPTQDKPIRLKYENFNGNACQLTGLPSDNHQKWGRAKDKRRISLCTPLMAHVTYVSVPWQTIIENIFENRQKPILTF